jgi:hypothetical protein
MMAAYTEIMNALAPAKYGLFNHDASSSTNYQDLRYGFASSLMGEGYYYNDTSDSGNELQAPLRNAGSDGHKRSDRD